MTVTQCDRCKTIIESPDNIYSIMAGRAVHRYCEAEIVLAMDLCPHCYDTLLDWAEKGKE